MDEITIKCDEQGFILLQCSLCGEFFKLLASDLNDECLINIWCPYCGLNGKNYITNEILYNGLKIAKNEAEELIYDMFKNFERQTKNNKFISYKSGVKPKKEIISPIKVKIENLEIKKFKCCQSYVKIKPITIEYGSYCPICGGIDYE